MDKKLINNFFKNGISFGSWVTFTSTASVEIMAKSGFNWLAIDMEHGPVSVERAQELIQVIELSGCVPLVRISNNNPVEIKKVMDAGAYGVIVPNVKRAADCLAAVKATRYPPFGFRGVGLARAQGYGDSFNEYKNMVNHNSIVIAQIEDKTAVENIEDILSTSGLSGVMIGPYDLSASYGLTGELNHPKLAQARTRVLEACRKFKVPAGIHIVFPDEHELKRRIKEGYSLIAFGVDMTFLLQECRKAKAALGIVLKSKR